mmetsp:Transcript_15968/g.15690  ORF Transcript_15968/g.15690 Transcript_15968/m.15690 type:complete len:102 (+) Transcript_15968:132-437(+)|eukprot:CAMPEP_0197010408 /NCGR_PEP_ID=MMETSP1380-20130617/54156_1 /TAXON_ID=5936 /ORGANISM="Euplotes crassus, Strain CT5" /LENGTH=101 /DNA_ID=CAMNT_0042432301 /DNA_START=132 /DNA_END=437 /DNA_ORIENTATION=+
MKGKLLRLPDGTYQKTKEGKKAVQEAILFLEAVKPNPNKMKLCKALCKSAQDHATDTGDHGIFGHVGSNGCEIEERVKKYIKRIDFVGENVNYNYFFQATD